MSDVVSVQNHQYDPQNAADTDVFNANVIIFFVIANINVNVIIVIFIIIIISTVTMTVMRLMNFTR